MKLYFPGGSLSFYPSCLSISLVEFSYKGVTANYAKIRQNAKTLFLLGFMQNFEVARENSRERDYLNSEYSYLIILLNAFVLKLSLFS